MIRKSYKESSIMENMNRRGQVALFVIVAIVIVAIFIWLLVVPKLGISGNEVNPTNYLRDCLQPDLDKALSQITEHGGDYTPSHFVLYNDNEIQYLCYTDENYKPCVVQQPLLVRHVELEIKEQLDPTARLCLAQLKEVYQKQGYTVSGNANEINVSIVPGSITLSLIAPFEVTKENTQVFRRFVVSRKSELYDLLATATSIIQYESTVGDSETLVYVQYYPDLKIEKLKRDKDTIYTLTNVVTNDKFIFATRSLVWPQGYGFVQT